MYVRLLEKKQSRIQLKFGNTQSFISIIANSKLAVFLLHSSPPSSFADEESRIIMFRVAHYVYIFIIIVITFSWPHRTHIIPAIYDWYMCTPLCRGLSPSVSRPSEEPITRSPSSRKYNCFYTHSRYFNCRPIIMGCFCWSRLVEYGLWLSFGRVKGLSRRRYRRSRRDTEPQLKRSPHLSPFISYFDSKSHLFNWWCFTTRTANMTERILCLSGNRARIYWLNTRRSF